MVTGVMRLLPDREYGVENINGKFRIIMTKDLLRLDFLQPSPLLGPKNAFFVDFVICRLSIRYKMA